MTPPRIAVDGSSLDDILDMREAYRREMDAQIVHDSWHARGFATPFLLRVDGDVVGYGAVGGPPGESRDVVKELFVVPAARRHALDLFRALVAASDARFVEAQTNDTLLLLMLFDAADVITSDTILFADGATTTLDAPAGTTLVRLGGSDRARAFTHALEPVGEWGLRIGGEVVATGGWLTHYNRPYADLHMEVAAEHRGRGLASFLLQELKRLCRAAGHVPAARCRDGNVASRRALERAGMLPCARIVRGRLAR